MVWSDGIWNLGGFLKPISKFTVSVHARKVPLQKKKAGRHVWLDKGIFLRQNIVSSNVFFFDCLDR